MYIEPIYAILALFAAFIVLSVYIGWRQVQEEDSQPPKWDKWKDIP